MKTNKIHMLAFSCALGLGFAFAPVSVSAQVNDLGVPPDIQVRDDESLDMPEIDLPPPQVIENAPPEKAAQKIPAEGVPLDALQDVLDDIAETVDGPESVSEGQQRASEGGVRDVSGSAAAKSAASSGGATAAADRSFDEDLFYDARDVVPRGEIGKRTARKVNPKLEPGSKLIVVRTDEGPDSVGARLISASRAVKIGRYESALDIYKGLYQQDKRNADVLMGVAVTLQKMGRFDAAIAAYEELLEFKPGYIDAEVNMLGLISMQYPQVGLTRLQNLKRKHPDNLNVVAQLAVTYAQIGDVHQALKYLGIAASMQPQNPSHMFNMAVIADRAGQRKMAVRYYEQALELDSVYGGGRTLPRDIIFDRLSRLR